MKLSIVITGLLTAFSVHANPIAIVCDVTENWTMNDIHYESKAVFSSADPKTGFTQNGTEGFNSNLEHFSDLILSTISQKLGDKDWIQASIYRGGNVIGSAAQFTMLEMSVNPEQEANHSDQFVQVSCSTKK